MQSTPLVTRDGQVAAVLSTHYARAGQLPGRELEIMARFGTLIGGWLGPLLGPGAPGSAPAPGPGAVLLLEEEFGDRALYGLREAVRAHASAAGMSGSRVLDVVLAVQELAANAVRHGAGQARLRMWAQDGTLCCQVQDGALPRAGREDEAGADPEWSYTQGHGLWLARRVTDRMSLESGPSGTRATVIFALR